MSDIAHRHSRLTSLKAPAFEPLVRAWDDPYARAAIASIAALTAIRMWLAFHLGLGVDESYASTMARDLDLSYFDDPPLHFWIAHFAQLVLGAGRMARLPFILIGSGTSWLLFALARRLFGAAAGLWSLAAYSLIPFFTVVSSSWILPDGPLNFLLLAATFQLTKLVLDDENDAPLSRYASIGLLIGLAALTKYHALLFALGGIGFVVASSHHRGLLSRPGFYLAIAIAALLNIPTLVWNAEHGWASFALQQHRAMAGGGIHVSHMVSQILGQLGLLAPWIVVPLALSLRGATRQFLKDDRYRLLLWLGIPNIVFFTVMPIFGIRGFPHWTMPGWIVVLPILGDFLARRAAQVAWPRKWLAVSTLVVAFLLVLVGDEVNRGWLGHSFAGLFAAGDPTIEAVEWTQIRSVPEIRMATGDADEFVATNWRDGGKLSQALGAGPTVIVLPDDPHGFAFRAGARGAVGARAMIVVRRSETAAKMAEFGKYFADIHVRATAAIGRGGRAEIPLVLLAARQVRLLDSAY